MTGPPHPPQPPAQTAAFAVRVWRALRYRPRLWLSALFGGMVYVLLPAFGAQHAQSRVLLAWNAGAVMYLLLMAHMMWRADAQGVRRRALQQDEGRTVILALVVLAAGAVLLAVGSQLAMVKGLQGGALAFHLGLSALTVFTSWLFTQSLFALHYAHDFYQQRSRHRTDPLAFPGTPDPDYVDFFYFACVIGTSGQTADVAFQGAALRRVGTLHCIVAFFFNTTLVALAINLAAQMF
jgi:uncharacterized membrane protein